MEYAVYFLQFDTPIHFGKGEEGEKLEESTLTYQADTLFGALCCELAAAGDTAGIENLVAEAQEGNLLFSDLFPYRIDSYDPERERFLFLPKPFLPVTPSQEQATDTYEKIKKESSWRKSQKKRIYVRASQLKPFLESLHTGKLIALDNEELGQGVTVTKVNCEESVSRPYYVHSFQIQEWAGFYGIIGYEDGDALEYVLDVLKKLGLSGIGGKRSSGYGKFHLRGKIWKLNQKGHSADDRALYAMLGENGTPYMSLSCLLPLKEEVPTVKEGSYTLCKRSGFVSPEGMGTRKKNDVYMIQAGSCFPQKMKGQIADVASDDIHPVWRYGKGLFAGLSL